MARQSRRKQTGVLGTLLVELSALAGIFGIAQPTVRNNLWQMVQPAAINSRADELAPRESEAFVSQPEFYAPNSDAANFNVPYSNVHDRDQVIYPSAYTAQAVVPQRAGNQAVWKASGYNPMGNYQ